LTTAVQQLTMQINDRTEIFIRMSIFEAMPQNPEGIIDAYHERYDCLEEVTRADQGRGVDDTLN